jgi:hypothetical protein
MTLDPTAFRYGFRIVGDVTGTRQLTKLAAAFLACASLDQRAELDRQSFLSAFAFGDDFRDHLEATKTPLEPFGSVRGFDGPCWSRWLVFDVDRADHEAATKDARRLAAFVVDRWRIDPDDLLIFFSGSKGYHVLVPLSACGSPAPSLEFNRVCRRLAENLAAAAGVTIDVAVYSKTQPLRSPNSRHPKTGLRKRVVAFGELLETKAERLRERAAEPLAFEVPDPPRPTDRAVADWRAAADELRDHSARRPATAGVGTEPPQAGKLNRATRDFIANGASEGERASRLFSAAANLAELGSPLLLAFELLRPAALDCGLPPAEVERTIKNGHKHGSKQP